MAAATNRGGKEEESGQRLRLRYRPFSSPGIETDPAGNAREAVLCAVAGIPGGGGFDTVFQSGSHLSREELYTLVTGAMKAAAGRIRWEEGR